jgi:hypothetical protein
VRVAGLGLPTRARVRVFSRVFARVWGFWGYF